MLGFASAAALCGARGALALRSSATAPALRGAWRTRAARPPARMMCAPGEDSAMLSVQRKLSEALTPDELEVVPTYGDPNGSHVSILVVSDAFEGLNVVKRHKLVYKAIWEELQGPIHAVDTLVTKTPAEVAK